MEKPEIVTEEQRKFEAMLKYYQQRVTTSVCNRTKLRAAVDDLVSFLTEKINELRVKLEFRCEEIVKLQVENNRLKASSPTIPTIIFTPSEPDESPGLIDGSEPVYTTVTRSAGGRDD
ncbi:MAG TPA: hypothetical protein PLY45_04090 [bacterium]|nr:hypothetical protein [bacterium]